LTLAAESSELDQQMSEVAAYFAGKLRGGHEVLFAEHLDRSKLDMSLASLHAVDEWLNVLLREKVDPNSEDSAETLVWAGAYVGEVIRACSARNYTWKRYEDYMSGQAESLRKLIPYTFGSQFVLASSSTKAMTLPLNKVVRYLAEGSENEIYFYASGECAK